jgi:hypothetical protein
MATLRAAELEVLFTADASQVSQAESDVQTIGQRIESNPITQTVNADTSEVVASATRVESAFETAFEAAASAGNGMSRSLVRDFLESGRASNKTAEEIESVLVRSYGVAADAARDLARATKGELQIEVDEAPALASMGRVEEAARRLVSQDTALKLDADITRADKNLEKAKQRLEDLQVRALGGLDVTADVRRAEANLQRVERNLAGLQNARTQIDIDPAPALASAARVENAVRRLVSQEVALKLDADVTDATAEIEKAKKKLVELELRALGGLDVTADTTRAQANLQRLERNLQGLQAARTMIEVETDYTQAESKLQKFFARFRRDSGEAGTAGGQSLASNLDGATRGAGERVGQVVGGDIEGTLVTALAAIPIAGGIVLAAVGIGKALTGAIKDGLQVDLGNDRLQALTGIGEGDALRLGRAAGEAYANVFGESVEANMDTARIALQFDLIDADTSTKGAQRTIEGLSGIADVLGEDVQRVATATTTALKAGIIPSAQSAFDLFAVGAREGVNRAEDLLDTFTEYPATFKRLGLNGEQALGLINQGLNAGARNSDLAADALKEFQIRATDASKSSTEGYEALGFNAVDMTAKIARGGDEAREGLDQVLTKLRETEDPVLRNAAAVGLFGTQAEDLGEALFAMDLSTAVDQLNGVTGAAQTMFDTLADNDATKLEQASRNIEVAADGMKGALAAAFSEPLGDAAEWVASNRGPMLQFFLDLANGALDFGDAAIDAAANGAEAFGEFVSGPLAEMVSGIAGAIDAFNGFEGRPKELDDLADSMRGFDENTADAADTIRGLKDGIDEGRTKLNEFGDGAVAMAYLNDATLRLAGAMGEVGINAEGAAYGLDGVDLANIRSSDSGKLLEDQVRNTLAAMSEQIDTASKTGESQENLVGRYNDTTDALLGQLEQMGLTREEAQALIDTVLQTPAAATTEFGSNVEDQQAKVQALAERVETLPDGNVVINASTADAKAKVDQFILDLNNIPGRRDVVIDYVVGKTGAPRGEVGAAYNAKGNILEFMAQGGLRGLTPMSHTAQVVPPSTWRVVGDRGDVPESFIPIDGSARSYAILLETMRRMGVMPMAQGGITPGESSSRSSGAVHQHTWYPQVAAGDTPEQFTRRVIRMLAENEREVTR